MRLLDFLFPPRVDEATLRDVSPDAFLAHLSPRVVSETRPVTVALFPFSKPAVRAALHEAKYHGSEQAFTYLGTALAEYLRDADDLGRKSVIVPVPLSSGRLAERGFNQVEEVVKRAVKQFPCEVDTKLLVRMRETVSQVSLPREAREKNMRGAFLVSPKPEGRRRIDPSYTYIVVDDVITTGATLQAAIDALQNAGAKHIIPLALAH